MDIVARAWQAMHDEGFAPELPPEAAQQLAALQEPTGVPDVGVQDLRDLLWSSIDNPDSRDLDQVEWVERLPNGDIRVRVGIADVDSLVPAHTPLDAYATRSTTSVYTGVVTFPMLPERLSTDLTSLNAGEDRRAIVTEFIVDSQGVVSGGNVFQALLRNQAKLDYESIGAWLEGHTPVPSAVAHVPGLEEQIRLQDGAADRLAARRRREGALYLETMEAKPLLTPEGKVELQETERNQARDLIENFMVAANAVNANFLSDHGAPSIERVVRPPERWSRIVALAESLGDHLPDTPQSAALAAFLARQHDADPLRFPDLSLSIIKLLGPGEYTMVRPGEHIGHFGLAAPAYTHSTAPNRRYTDLVVQRQIKALLNGQTLPYNASDLDLLAHHCTERENASRQVERLMRKVAAAIMFADCIGEIFEAVVTGVSSRKGTFVRVMKPPVEGRVVQGERGLDVGDVVKVRLIATDPVQGFIDFARDFSG